MSTAADHPRDWVTVLWFNGTGHLDKGGKIEDGGVPQWPRNDATMAMNCMREAVRLVTEQGYGVSETARNWGINAQMLGRWQRAVAALPKAAVPGNGRVSVRPRRMTAGTRGPYAASDGT